jgi:hypothetical protein
MHLKVLKNSIWNGSTQSANNHVMKILIFHAIFVESASVKIAIQKLSKVDQSYIYIYIYIFKGFWLGHIPVFIKQGELSQYILKVHFKMAPLHKHIIVKGSWQHA